MAEHNESSFKPRQATPLTGSLQCEVMGSTSVDVSATILSTILPAIRPDSIIHDNGCGVGVVTEAIINANPHLTQTGRLTFHATDVQRLFLAETAKLNDKHNLPQSIRTAEMPAEALTFPDALFDYSFPSFAIFRIPADRAAAHIYRTLKSGGMAVVTTWHKMPHGPAVEKARRAIWGVSERLVDAEWEKGSHLKAVLETAGFDGNKVEVSKVNVWLVRPDFHRWAQITWSMMGQPADGWTKEDEDKWDEEIALYEQKLKDEGFEIQDDGSFRVKMTANVAVATK